jgi:Uma2 family endonuclease
MTTNPLYVAAEDYLLAEEYSPTKHEYIKGEIYAMAGASKPHVIITLNLASMLRNHLRGTGCLTYISDMKVHVEKSNSFYYPDIVVSCDPRDRNSENFLEYPSLIVEVLSASTSAFDRGHKFADYRNIETLQEYLLINQESPEVECYRLNAAKRWELYPYSLNEQVYLASIDFYSQVSQIYEDVL